MARPRKTADGHSSKPALLAALRDYSRQVIEKATGRSWAALEPDAKDHLTEHRREMETYPVEAAAAAALYSATVNAVRFAGRHRGSTLARLLRDSGYLRAFMRQRSELRRLSHWPGRASVSQFTAVIEAFDYMDFLGLERPATNKEMACLALLLGAAPQLEQSEGVSGRKVPLWPQRVARVIKLTTDAVQKNRERNGRVADVLRMRAELRRLADWLNPLRALKRDMEGMLDPAGIKGLGLNSKAFFDPIGLLLSGSGHDEPDE